MTDDARVRPTNAFGVSRQRDWVVERGGPIEQFDHLEAEILNGIERILGVA